MRDRAQIATLEAGAVDVTAILKAIAGDEAAEAA
jgi:galactofuranose transport system ATP-binding protein